VQSSAACWAIKSVTATGARSPRSRALRQAATPAIASRIGCSRATPIETTEQHCKTVYDTHEKQVGYDVHYRLDGVEKSVKMDHHPGERIPVQDGKLVLTQSEPTKV
jgi:hypothetical protein